MTPIPALVLAGSRLGEHDPVARIAGVPHKVLAPVAGEAMVSRVLGALEACPRIAGIVLVSDIGDELRRLPRVQRMERSGRLQLREAASSPSLSVAQVFAEFGAPLLVTTGDHALLDPPILAEFLAGAERGGSDLAVGLVEERVIAARVPSTRRTYLRFRDTAVSGANLFLLRTPAAAAALGFWRRVEAERKRPWKLAAAFGPRLLLGFLLHGLTLERAFVLAGRRLGLAVAPVLLSAAVAAIDVDRPEDLQLVRQLAAARAQAEPVA